MNIFYLDKDPEKSAEIMSNKHVIKMILESAQLLCITHRVLDGKQGYQLSKSGRLRKYWFHLDRIKENNLYKATHINHPCSKWVRESSENYKWMYEHFLALCYEYQERYHKTHASYIKLNSIVKDLPKNIPIKEFTEPPQAMPDKYRSSSSITAYHNYYRSEKLFTEEDRNRYYKILGVKNEINYNN